METEAIFEEIRAKLEGLSCPAREEDRKIQWISHGRMGIAKDKNGAYELFFGEGKLTPKLALVRKSLEYGKWESEGGAQYDASRIVLSAESHFLAVSALIGAECVLAGIEGLENSVHEVFTKVEPVIELALKKASPSDELVLGLIGELLLLEHLLAAIPDAQERRSDVLDMWRGYTASSRDFVIGGSAIEVKATRKMASSHFIHSLAQVEPLELPGGILEEPLLLLSIGLANASGGGFSLPVQVEKVLTALQSSPGGNSSILQGRFLDSLRRYGAFDGWGYDHAKMNAEGRYKTPYTLTFSPRLYNLLDADIRIIRTHDLQGTHVNPGHVEYQMDLPEKLKEGNPSSHWETDVKNLCRTALGLGPIT